MDPTLTNIVADLFINLSAGWFGAAIIFPVNARRLGKIHLGLLTINIILGILFLIFAFIVNKYFL